MNNYADDALDIIELNENSALTELCRKQEATLPNYILKLATKLTKVIKKAFHMKGVRNEDFVRLGECSDRWIFCLGSRISRFAVHTSGHDAVYITLDWAEFIRDHKLHAVANRLLEMALSKLHPGYRVLLHGETFKHEHEFLIKKLKPISE